ncbi:MAG: hypothetical protein H0W89_01755 [Candidatus Levybacteria bacterium]|nr:hypothetical protein [Candidatus Levybacteria bacterium]
MEGGEKYMESNTNTTQPVQEKSHSSAMTVGIIAAVVGLGVGLLGGSAYGKNMAESQPQAMTADKTGADSEKMMAPEGSVTVKSADLRVLLNGLEKQHVDLASAAVRNGFDGDPDFKASADALDLNSVAIAGAVGSVYGPEAEASFLEIWRSHIGFFVDYTVAAKGSDKAGMDKAVANLGGYVDALSDLLSGANPNLPREAVAQLLTEHVGLLKGAVDAYGAGDYAGSYAKQAEAYTQVGTIADALSGAIVKQYPEKF